MLTGISVFWFGLHGRHRAQPPDLRHRRRARTTCAAARCWSSGWRCCRSSASCAATSRARAGRTTWPPAASAASRCPPGLQESEQLPRADLHARRRRPRWATTRRSTSSATAELVGDRALAERLRDVSIAVYETVAAYARERGHHPGRHQVRVRPRRGRRAGARRRGLHAGLVALLARRRLRARPRPAVLRQAVRARLGVGHRLGQGAARRPRFPTTSSPARASATWTAYERLAGEPFESWLATRCAPGPDPPEGRDPRSPGPDGRAGAAGARLRRRVQRARRPPGRARGRRTRRGCPRCASSCWRTR